MLFLEAFLEVYLILAVYAISLLKLSSIFCRTHFCPSLLNWLEETYVLFRNWQHTLLPNKNICDRCPHGMLELLHIPTLPAGSETASIHSGQPTFNFFPFVRGWVSTISSIHSKNDCVIGERLHSWIGCCGQKHNVCSFQHGGGVKGELMTKILQIEATFYPPQKKRGRAEKKID